MKAFTENTSFKEALMQDARVMKHLNERQIDDLLDPEKYLGTVSHQVETTLAAMKAARQKD